jgi:hypothetical protein
MWIRAGIAVLVLGAAAQSFGALSRGDVSAHRSPVRVLVHARVGACALDVGSRPVTLRVSCPASHRTRAHAVAGDGGSVSSPSIRPDGA